MALKVTDDQLKKAHDKGLSLTRAAEYLGVTVMTVSRRWKRIGLKPNRPNFGNSNRVIKHWSVLPETIQKVNTMADKTGRLKGEIVEAAIDAYYTMWQTIIKDVTEE